MVYSCFSEEKCGFLPKYLFSFDVFGLLLLELWRYECLVMVLRAIGLAMVFGGASLLVSVAHALEPDAVDAKFSKVRVLTPVTKDGDFLPLENVGMVAFFSPLAADLFAQEWRKRDGNQGEFRVAPLALTQFEAAYLSVKKADAALTKVYLPDPAQIPAVVGLQLQQGVKADQAQALAQSQPYVFCPDPLIRITQTKDGKSSTVVPCAFTFTSMALLVNSSNQEAKSTTVLRAYSLQEMVRFLSEQSGDDARNLVISSPIVTPDNDISE